MSIDITQLTPDQRAALLAELQASEPAPAASEPAPAPTPVQGSVTLDDLANDPTLIATLTQEEALALFQEAESLGQSLAGTLLQDLNATANGTVGNPPQEG